MSIEQIDGVRWKSRKVCRTEINAMLRELT